MLPPMTKLINHRGVLLELIKEERANVHQQIMLMTDHSFQTGGNVFGDGTDDAINHARRRLAELDFIIGQASPD
jgi:hypothetical protein